MATAVANLLVEPKPIVLAEGTEAAVPATTLDQYVSRYASPETVKELTEQAIFKGSIYDIDLMPRSFSEN